MHNSGRESGELGGSQREETEINNKKTYDDDSFVGTGGINEIHKSMKTFH